MDTRKDGSVVAVLAVYQNNLVSSKMMTSQVVQRLLLEMSRKVDFGSEGVSTLIRTPTRTNIDIFSIILH